MQYASLKEKIAAEKIARAEKHAGYAALLQVAQREGFAAGERAKPHTMVVTEPSTGQVWYENEGACGFAWVIVRNANKGFGAWLIKSGNARKSYYGGAEIWISAHNQSVERKIEHATAMAQIFRNAGFDSYAGSRLD